MHLLKGLMVFALIMCPTILHGADKVYEKPSSFLKRHFGSIPKTQGYNLTAADDKQFSAILGHKYKQRKVRYWAAKGKWAVILEEVGKSEPITMGFVIKRGKILEVKVLIYRESHGREVSRPTFTKQFVGATLKGTKVSAKIDGIVGATLSVRAIQKLSASALYLSGKLDK